MRFCLSLACCWIAGAAALCAAGIEGPRQIRSTVKADLRTGRLVRTFVAVGPAARQNAEALNRMIDQTAARYGLDPLLVHSVIKVESDYNQYAVSPKGAEGIMQLMPGTARRFEVANAFDAAGNIEGGVRYLKYLLDTFKDQDLAVAAYNAGEKAVIRYGAVPPYKETADYVRKVSKHHRAAKQAAEAKKAQVAAAAPPAVRVEEFEDEQGVVHIRTVTQ